MQGVFMFRAEHGYTVNVDGVTLPLELSWTDANLLAEFIGLLRFSGDARGYARCLGPDHSDCFQKESCTVHSLSTRPPLPDKLVKLIHETHAKRFKEKL